MKKIYKLKTMILRFFSRHVKSLIDEKKLQFQLQGLMWTLKPHMMKVVTNEEENLGGCLWAAAAWDEGGILWEALMMMFVMIRWVEEGTLRGGCFARSPSLRIPIWASSSSSSSTVAWSQWSIPFFVILGALRPQKDSILSQVVKSFSTSACKGRFWHATTKNRILWSFFPVSCFLVLFRLHGFLKQDKISELKREHHFQISC